MSKRGLEPPTEVRVPPHLDRFAQVLASRDAPVRPILAAVTASGTSVIYLAASAFTRRIDLLIPFTPDALAAIAPNVAVGAVPARAMLRITIDGDRVGAARIVVGPSTSADAVDDAGPATAREAWRAIVDQLQAFAAGTISSRTRVLTEPRGAIAVRYPARDAAAEPAFQDAIVAVASRLGVPGPQQALWRALHAATGTGAAVTVATQCEPAGPTPELGFLYRITQWDQAITLIQRIAEPAQASAAAAALGPLAGMLARDAISGGELRLGPAGPDLVVWTTLRAEPAELNPFEAALTHPGPLVAAWDHEDNAQTRMCLFYVGGDRVTQLAETTVAAETRENLVDRLVARNIRIGGMYAGTGYVWVVDEDGFTVWSSDTVVASGTRTSRNVAGVTLFVDPAYDGHRGVRFTLASGASEIVVEEDDPIPRIDPAYGADELFLDTLWAHYLGNDLATWLLVPFANERSSGTNEMGLTVTRAARTLADQIDRPGGGELLGSMGAVGRSANLAFRVDAARTAIDLQLTFADGETATLPLKQGTPAQLAGFLRRVTTPSTVLSAMNIQITEHAQRRPQMTGLWFGASGPDNLALARAIGDWAWFSGTPETIVLDYRTEKRGSANWLEVARTCKFTARVVWSQATEKALTYGPGRDHLGSVGCLIPEYPVTVAAVLAAFAELPFEVAALQTPFDDLWKLYRAPGFSDHKGPHGWACLFKGAGHERLVSRRWLEHGPWLLHRGPNDTSLVQFHALDATMEQAIEQARPAHQRMGISSTGGFLQTSYVYAHKPDGLYVPADRSLRILITGRDVSEREMLDAAAYGKLHRDVAAQPIASVRFIFVDGEARARAHLHQLWLRELECWAIIDGVEQRLDAAYAPARPPPPAWA